MTSGKLGPHWTELGVEGFFERQRILGSSQATPLHNPGDEDGQFVVTDATTANTPLVEDVTALLIAADGCMSQFHGRHSFLWIQVW